MSEGSKKIHPTKCSVCEEPVIEQFRPFCSSRCATIDLGRWLTGKYVVSGSEDADEDGGLPLHDGAFHESDDEDPTRH